MSALDRYRTWLTAEVKQAPDSCKPGLVLAQSMLEIIQAASDRVPDEFCGVVTMPPGGDAASVCLLPAKHYGPHGIVS